MDCELAQWLMMLHPLPGGELPGSERSALQAHLRTCEPCAERAAALAREHTALARAMRAVPIPPALETRLLDVTQARARRRWLRRLVWGSALTVAAAVLLAVGLLLYPRPQEPPINLDYVAQWARLRWLPSGPATATDALRFIQDSLGTTVVLPPDLQQRWEFGNLAAVYFELFGNHYVPVLEFRNQTAHALVVLLRQDQFDPEQLAAYDTRDDRRSGVLLPAPGEWYTALVLMRQGSALDLLK
jgi:hypothetical protein